MKTTDYHFKIIAKARLESTHQDVDDWEDEFIDEDSYIVTTRDTLEDFKEGSKGWTEKRGFRSFELQGHFCLSWESMQGFKGQARGSMVVVDFGEFRCAYKF